MPRAAYEIHAIGNVPVDMLEDFAGITVIHQPVGSTIHADLADEAELHGILDALRRGGFELIDVRREPQFDRSEQTRPDPSPVDEPRADD